MNNILGEDDEDLGWGSTGNWRLKNRGFIGYSWGFDGI